MSFYRIGDRGVIFGATPRSVTFEPSVAPSAGRLWMGLGGPDDFQIGPLPINIMKTARKWVVNRGAGFGGGSDAALDAVLDADGYPQSIPAGETSFSTLLLTQQNALATALNGRYRFLFDGSGTFDFFGVTNLTIVSPGVIEFDFTSSDGGNIEIKVLTVASGNHPRNWRIFKVSNAALFAAGQKVRSDYPWGDVKGLRFMDLQKTNTHNTMGHAGAGTLSRATGYSWNWRGISVLEICEIANELGVDPWVCIPHTAEDAYVTEMATVIRDNLNTSLKCRVQWSNEPWNFQFPQTQYAQAQAIALFTGQAGFNPAAPGDAWFQWAGGRAAQCMDIFSTVFTGQTSRIVRVMDTNTAFQGLEQAFMLAPRWVTATGRPQPRLSFDAYAVTGYFDGDFINPDVGAGTAPLLAAISGGGYAAGEAYALSRAYGSASVSGSLAALYANWAYHRGVCNTQSYDLVMYEGGTHVVGIGAANSNTTLTDFFVQYNYSAAMGQLYRDAMIAWDAVGDDGFNHFVDYARPSQFGCWGAMRYVGDTTTRSTVLAAYNEAPLASALPVPLSARVAVTGHSIPDAIYVWPWAGVIEDAGFTPSIIAGTGPFATAQIRWNDDPAGPDSVKALLTAGNSTSRDIFLGIEAHGGSYGGRASVQAHIEFSDAYGYAVLWHNLAASKGAQTFYGNFWRNNPGEVWNSAWRASCDVEAPLWDGIIDYVNANRAAGTPAMRLVPWLQVAMAIYDAIQAGTVTGTTMGNFFADDVHMDTPQGRWVLVATSLAVMYRRHPNQLGTTFRRQFTGSDSIDPGLAAQLRPIIWATCLANTRAGLA